MLMSIFYSDSVLTWLRCWGLCTIRRQGGSWMPGNDKLLWFYVSRDNCHKIKKCYFDFMMMVIFGNCPKMINCYDDKRKLLWFYYGYFAGVPYALVRLLIDGSKAYFSLIALWPVALRGLPSPTEGLRAISPLWPLKAIMSPIIHPIPNNVLHKCV